MGWRTSHTHRGKLHYKPVCVYSIRGEFANCVKFAKSGHPSSKGRNFGVPVKLCTVEMSIAVRRLRK